MKKSQPALVSSEEKKDEEENPASKRAKMDD